MLDIETIAPVLRTAFDDRLTVSKIQYTVAAFYDIQPFYMQSKHRERRVARPRQIAMYLARTMTPNSLKGIGNRFGGKDHSTVIHAIKTVERLIEADPFIAIEVEVLKENLA